MVTPNQLTALRIVIAFASPVLLIWYRSVLSEILVVVGLTVACVTDWWDGYLARRMNMVTRAGTITDPIADKLLILGLMASFALLGLYSFEWIVPIVIRELAVTWARLLRLTRGQIIPAEWAGKLKVGFQVGSLYASLVFLILFDSVHLENHIFKLPAVVLLFFQAIHYLGIILANVVTVVSGILFFYRLNRS